MRPLRRRAASTLRPPFVAIRARNPWVFARFRLLGWYVLFTVPPRALAPVRGKARRLYAPRVRTSTTRIRRDDGTPVARQQRTVWSLLARCRVRPWFARDGPHPTHSPSVGCSGPLSSMPPDHPNLWILWKTQVSRLWTLWIMSGDLLLQSSAKTYDAQGLSGV